MRRCAQKQTQRGASAPTGTARSTAARPAPAASERGPRFAHDFSAVPVHPHAAPTVAAKLTVLAPGDADERDAQRLADQALQASAPPRLERGRSRSSAHVAAPATVPEVLRSRGHDLEPTTRSFMETRFGYDFGRVRVHTGASAAASARSIQALAYTAGQHVVFGEGRYAPQTEGGKRMLAHELAHVVQGGDRRDVSTIARFSDTDHNIVEEAALTLANMKPEEIERIHEGNTKRDYSQSPAELNLLLQCEPKTYGGYKAHEHFDNFRWDEALQAFQSRENPGAFGKKNPISYVDEELVKFVDALPAKAAFEHVGSAFHAIEDFFAHSNFVELTHGDFVHGRELITGGGSGGGDVSLLTILERISSEETAPYYGGRANAQVASAPPGTHSRMAKDFQSNRYHREAILLAALVVKELGADILALEGLTEQDAR